MGLLKKVEHSKSITIIPNIFKPISSRVTKTGSWKTIGEAYDSTGCAMPFGAFSWVVNGTDVTVPEYPVLENAVINGYVFQAETAEAQGGAAKIGGWLMVAGGIVAGVALGWTGVGGALAGGLIGSGVGLILGGSVLLFGPKIPDLSADNAGKKPPSIRGGNNRFNIGGATPLILGKHRIAPDYAGEYFDLIPDAGAAEVYAGRVQTRVWVDGTSLQTPGHFDYSYTDKYISTLGSDVSVSKKQIFYALFCTGQKSLTITESSFRIGDRYLTSFTEYDTEIIQNGDVSTLIPRSVNVINVGKELRYTDDITAADGAAIATLPKGIDEIQADIIFPGGAYRVDSDGDTGSKNIILDVYWREVGGVSWVFLKNITTAAQDKDGFRIRWEKASLDTTKQYEFSFRRGEKEPSNTSKYIDKSYLGSVRCFRPVPDVITEEYRDNLSFVALQMKSTNQLTGPIDTFNLIAQTNIRNYDGSGSGAAQWPAAATSNPASIVLYLLTSTEVVKADYAADAEIDWSSFEDWHNFCVTKSYECNYVVSEPKPVGEIIELVATCGRAQVVKKEGKYSVIVDKARTAPVQMFTERNSWAWRTTKAYPTIPDAVRVNFIDQAVDYQQTQAIIPKDATAFPSILNPSYQSADYPGVTNYNQLWGLTRYRIACGILRAEAHTFETDIEHIRCTRGDWVKVQSPAILWGIGPGARIKSVTMTGPNVTKITTDEYFFMEAAKTYAVGFRKSDGTLSEKAVNSPALDETTNEFTFSTPFSTNLPAVLDLLAFGETSYVTSDLLVQEISWREDGGATIKGVEYAPTVYDADSGAIPAFDPRISIPGENNTGSFLGNIPPDESAELQALNAIAANNAVTSRALLAQYPDLYKATTAPAIWFAENTNGFNFYGEMTNGIIRQKEIQRVGLGVVVTTGITGPMTLNGENGLVYTNQTNGSVLYWIEPTDTNDGSALTTAQAWSPTANNDTCFYINADQGNTIYKTTVSTSAANGTQVATFPVVWIEYCAATDEIFYLKSNGSIYRKPSTDDTAGTAVYTGTAVSFSVSVGGDSIIYIDDADLGVYQKSVTTTASADGVALYLLAIHCYLAPSGNIYLTSGNDSGYLYLALRDRAVETASIAAQQTGYIIEGTIASGSNLVSAVSVEDLDVIEVNDRLEGTGIAEGSFIQVKGPTYFIMSEVATGTGTPEITVSGSRVFLDANRVVVPGTIQARLLSASAINSKARTDGGFYKSDFDLDAGTIKLRADNDTIVLDFDPDRTDEELQLTGTIQSGNYVAGSAGWSIDNDGNAELETVEIRNITGSNLTITADLQLPFLLGGKSLLFQTHTIKPCELGDGLAISGVGNPAIATMTADMVAFIDDSNDDLRAYKRTGANTRNTILGLETWELVGSELNISGVSSPALAALNSTDVAFIDAANDELRTYRFNGSTWSLVGSGLAISGIGVPALAALNSTDVAFIDAANDELRTYRFNGSTWSLVGSGLAISGTVGPALAAINSTDVAFIDATLEELRTYRFNGSTWSLVGSGLSISGIGFLALAAINSTDVAFIDATLEELRTYRFNGSTWSLVGSGLSISGIGSFAISAINSTDVAFIDLSLGDLRLYRAPNEYTTAIWV